MRILQTAKSNNQNNFRLTDLAPLKSLPNNIKNTIEGLLASKGDRAHQAAGVFLWSLVTHRNPVTVLSLNDMDKLISKAAGSIPEGSFKMSSTRGQTTIYSQFTGFMASNGFFRIILNSKGNKPAVIEIIDSELLALLNTVNNEIRLTVVHSVDKSASLQFDNSSIQQSYNTTSLQSYNSTSLSESQYEKQSETQNETQDVVDITQLQQTITVKPKTSWGTRKKNIV